MKRKKKKRGVGCVILFIPTHQDIYLAFSPFLAWSVIFTPPYNSNLCFYLESTSLPIYPSAALFLIFFFPSFSRQPGRAKQFAREVTGCTQSLQTASDLQLPSQPCLASCLSKAAFLAPLYREILCLVRTPLSLALPFQLAFFFSVVWRRSQAEKDFSAFYVLKNKNRSIEFMYRTDTPRKEE